MFRFIKKAFFATMTFFSCNALKCVSVNNQNIIIIRTERKIRTQILNINSDNPLFYPYSIQANKCSGSCNNISDPYANLCVPNVVKNINVKVFNMMPRTNKTRHIEWHETCKCRLDASVCNNKQRSEKGKCRCECREFIDKRICDKGFTWNSSNCQYECDKLCDIGEYLHYENYKCRKKLVGKLVEECSENIDGNEMIHKDFRNVCNSCQIYLVLLVITFLIIIGISTAFMYFH